MLTARDNKFINKLKLNSVKFLFKNYNYKISKKLISKIGIAHLDLRDVSIPKDRNFFQNLPKKYQIENVNLPYIDFDFYNFNMVSFIKSKFTMCSNKDIEYFVDSICRISFFRCIDYFPPGDYSNVSFNSLNLWRSTFHKDCILPKDINLFQNIKRKNLIKTELPIECLKNIHLYNLNDVKINLNLHNWYKDILQPYQITLIMKKYPSQINKNIILPNYI